MIRITRGTPTIEPNNMVQEIKHIRTYLHERYEYVGGFKLVCALVNDIMQEQADKAPIEVNRADAETLRAMVRDLKVRNSPSELVHHLASELEKKMEGMGL